MTGTGRRRARLVEIQPHTDGPLFEQAYHDILTPSYRNHNELDNCDHLFAQLSWNDANRSHAIVALDKNENPVAIIIGDFFSRSSTGVIEYLACRSLWQGRGLTSALFGLMQDALHADALAFDSSLSFLAMEVDYQRTMWARRHGFHVLDIPYTQPPLSPKGKALTGLHLSVKPIQSNWIPCSLLLAFLEDYFSNAMHVQDAEGCLAFKRVAAALAGRDDCPFVQ